MADTKEAFAQSQVLRIVHYREAAVTMQAITDTGGVSVS